MRGISSVGQNSKDPVAISSLYLLLMVLRRFPSCLEVWSLDVSKDILRSAQNSYPEARQLAVTVCKSALQTSDSTFQMNIKELVQGLSRRLGKPDSITENYKWTVDVAELLIKGHSMLIVEFETDGIPPSLLEKKEVRVSAFAVIPFVGKQKVRCFTPDVYSAYLTKMQPLIGKRSSNSREALLSEGKLIHPADFHFDIPNVVMDKS
jgi:hypothetical protein